MAPSTLSPRRAALLRNPLKTRPRAFVLSCPYRRGFAPLTSSSPSQCGPRSQCCGSSHWEGLLKNNACSSSGETEKQEKIAVLVRSRSNVAHCADKRPVGSAFLWQMGHLQQNALFQAPTGSPQSFALHSKNAGNPSGLSPALPAPPLCSHSTLFLLLFL